MVAERALGFVAAACVFGCGPATNATAPATTTAPASGPLRYLPLEDGTVFSYETSTTPGNDHGLLVLEVRRPRPATAEFVVAGRVTRFTITPDAVAHAAGGFLLREPLTPGAEWHGDFGHVRLTRSDARVTVGAGTFTACLETVEELATREATKRTTTTFCPGVGIALRLTEVEQGGEAQSARIALKSYGKRFDPNASGH
jgi:hypothetical protein